MIKLCDIVDIQNNDLSSITLKVKEDKEIDLINLGFNPKLEYIYLSKGKRHTMKFIDKDMNSTSFDFGDGGYTLISNNLQDQKQKVLNCITDDFGITYYGERKDLEKTSYINSLDSKIGLHFNLQLQWFDESNIVLHRDNNYFKSFNNLNIAKKYITDHYDICESYSLRLSENTGCKILEYDVVGKDLSKNLDGKDL